MNKKIKVKDKIRTYVDMKSFILAFSALILTVLLISPISSQIFTGSSQIFTRANVAISPSSGDISFPFMFNREMCEAGQDFILQISPIGCIPSVVRSDLLEEQNVPVFCPIVATQLNPLIDVEAINTMTFSFSGVRPPEVSGIGYYPARAALGRTGKVTQPILNNLGYAVIVLKQQRNESAMPDFVGGNLTARIRYDIKNAFGVGQAVFYLPEITDEEEWNRNFKRYSFWEGRGYLRAESIGDDRASISIYSDRETHGLARTNKRKIATKILNVGETSGEMFMPGFDYCLGSMQLKLNGLEAPGTRARLNINGDVFELKEREKFIDNKCKIKKIEKQGLVEKVTINCQDDYRSGTFPLTIRPRINLSIGGTSKEYGVGDIIYEWSENDEKRIFLGYIGQTFDGKDFIIPVVSPAHNKEQFLDSFAYKNLDAFVKLILFAKGRGILSEVLTTFYKGTYGPIIMAGNFIVTGSFPIALYYKGGEDQFNIVSLFTGIIPNLIESIFSGREIPSIEFIDFAGPKDIELSEGVKDYYENAINDYDRVIDSFSEEKYPKESETSLGEEALYNKIELMWRTNQKRSVVESCKEFEDRYPNKIPPKNCEEAHKLSNVEISSRDVVIDDRIYRIAFDGIREPDFDEYGVEIFVSNAGNYSGLRPLERNQVTYVSENEYIIFKEVRDDFAVFDVRGITQGLLKELTYKPENLRIDLNDYHIVGTNKYKITLSKINLQKVAKVSVKPNIKYTQTEATFPFRIGIEKRAIQLSPEKTEERIESLNNTIEVIRSISDTLETAVKVGKAACLGVGGWLTVKNFFANLKGEGIARQEVMRGSGGWFDICEEEVLRGNYRNVDSCLLAKNPEIEASVEEYADIIEEQNERFNELQEGITKKRFLGEDVVDTEELMNRYVDNNYTTGLETNLQNKFVDNKIRIGNEDVDVSKIIELIGPDTTFITQARNLELNARLLNSDDPVIRKIAEGQIKADLGDIWINAKNEVERKRISDEFGFPVTIGSTEKLTDIPITHRTTFAEVKNKFSGGGLINDNSYVHMFVDESDANKYLLVLTDNYVINKTYLIETGNILKGFATEENQKNPLHLSIKYYESNTYKNKYKNAEVRYYATGQYKGLPAIVPFDINGGWYVATKPAIPILGKIQPIQPYYDSRRASSFYLCNVGSNGREEFFSEIGDDICRGFVVGASQPPDFPGLSASESLNKRIRAEEALLEAQRRYRPGMKEISIFGQTITVGSPTVGIPDIQCQDFMSPSDCNLLFNVCDPVICPSSRCDLGGTYPVSDVIQSGIFGSLALCLPNFPEVKIPVCISGVHAGLEAYLSVLDSYQACLETSLETGQTIGICDEIHSVYMCDFLWRQALPLAKYIIPQIIGSVLGKNVRGGGEYLGFQDAWQRAGDSVGFFTQYYAANSFQAFKARSADEIGTEICKNWVSLMGPGDGRLFDALIEPDVPPQFYGRFDEIPFTTATVPAMSHYKVFYHVYAGKDFPAYYQVYLRGTGEAFYRDVPIRRMVASGFIKAEEYATETKDFTAPAGYNELCIVVNNREECGFKQVTTEFGINYITEQYLKQQASKTEITKEAACVSGTPSVFSLLSPNIQAGLEEGINPAIYNRGITRICATENPGKATDPFFGTNKSRWRDVGYCDNTKLRCWLDTKSVKDTIKITSIEEKVLDDVTPDYLDVLEEGGYVENFDGLVSDIKAEKDPVKRIELIDKKYNKVYFMHEKGYLTFLRGNEYALLTSIEILLAESPVPEPPSFELRGEEPETITDTTIPDSGTPAEPEIETCSTERECQQYLGGKIIDIARQKIERFETEHPEIDYETVEEDTGADSFECLVLQVAMTESNIRHCDQYSDSEGNPLYCEGDRDELITGDEFNSLGIMQINIQAHPDVNVADFEENVNYGTNLLIENYNNYGSESRLYDCNGRQYTGWRSALRYYNGWIRPPSIPDCSKGNVHYVEDVISYKDEVVELFPEVCGS